MERYWLAATTKKKQFSLVAKMWRLSNQQTGRYVWGSGAAAVMATGGVVMAWMFRNEKVENDDDDAPLWEGQVLKRQVRQPKLPYPLWDYDWDGRMTEQTTLQAQSESIHETVTGTTRHIILIRHGQYEERHHVSSVPLFFESCCC